MYAGHLVQFFFAGLQGQLPRYEPSLYSKRVVWTEDGKMGRGVSVLLGTFGAMFEYFQGES